MEELVGLLFSAAVHGDVSISTWPLPEPTLCVKSLGSQGALPKGSVSLKNSRKKNRDGSVPVPTFL